MRLTATRNLTSRTDRAAASVVLKEEILVLGEEGGPRLGSFIALYGLEETRALIERTLAGELVRERGAATEPGPAAPGA
jgi:hypothetical protein